MPKLIPQFRGRRPKVEQGLPETGRMEPPRTLSPESNPGRPTSKDEVQVDPAALSARAREAAAAAKDEHAVRLSQMTAGFPAFAESDEVKSYAEFVLQKLNPEFARDPSRTVAIPILDYTVPAKRFATDDTVSPGVRAAFRALQGGDWPEGPQQIVLTPQGLREYGATAGRGRSSRPVNPEALALSGVSLDELEKAVRSKLSSALESTSGGRTVELETAPEDRLRTTGMATTADVPALMAKVEEALQDAAPWKRGERVLELVRSETSGMTPAEFKSFSTQLMNRMRESTWWSGYGAGGHGTLTVFSRHLTELAVLIAQRARTLGLRSDDLGWFKHEAEKLRTATFTSTGSYAGREPDGRTTQEFWGGPYWTTCAIDVWAHLIKYASLPRSGPEIELCQKMGWYELT